MSDIVGYVFGIIVMAWMAAAGLYNTYDGLRNLPEILKSTVADCCPYPERTNVWKFIAEQFFLIFLFMFWPLVGFGGLGALVLLIGKLLG